MRYVIEKESLRRGRTIESVNYAIKDTQTDKVVARFKEDFKAQFLADSFNEADASNRYEFEELGTEGIDA
jgi:hypothetical protein